MPAHATPTTYAALRQAVEAVVLKGRQAIDDAWLRTYHDTGRLIHEHVLLQKDRAAYGAQVFNRLSADTGIDKRTLQQTVQFYRYFPIARHGAQLGWAHYRTLIQVEDKAKREELLRLTTRNHWTSLELIGRVRALNASLAEAAEKDEASPATPPMLLTPKRGTPGLCRIVAASESLAADLGFACFRELTPAEARGLKPGAFARIEDRDRVVPAPDAKASDLYTYAATILKVVDGDTLWIKVVVAPGVWVKQKLRLRDLDCPEVATAEGKAAKRFGEGYVARTQAVTICTTKPDKYDRYLADVFLQLDDGSEVFLNNAVLAAGHAVVKKAWEFGDWET